jgi:hypothetical protein
VGVVMALEKKTLEFPIKGGLMEKVPDELQADGFANRAENVDLRKDGAIRKRRGFQVMPTAAIVDNAPSTLDLNIRRMGTRDGRSLVLVSDDSRSLGSGGGSAGQVGSTVYEYAAEPQSWIARGSIPIPTVEAVWGQTKISEKVAPRTAVAVLGDYMLVASKCLFEKNQSVVAELVDLNENTCVLNDSFPSMIPVGGVAADAGLYVFCADAEYIYVDTGNPSAGFVQGTLPGIDTIISVSSDGTFIFILHRVSGLGDFILEKFDSGLTSLASVVVSSSSTGSYGSVDARMGTYVDVVYYEGTNGLGIRYDTNLATVWPVYTYGADPLDEEIFVTTVSVGATAADGKILICWRSSTENQHWVLISNGLYVGIQHVVTGYFIRCQPWMMNGHCYSVSNDSNQTTDATYPRYACTMYCIEIDVDDGAASNDYKTCLPSASWLTDIGSTECHIRAYQSNSKSYVIHGRWVDGGDTDWDVAKQVNGGNYFKIRPTVTALNFSEAKRYQNVEWNGLTVFAGGTPWVYDGLHCHEATHLHWPRLTITNNAAGAGTLVLGETYFFRSVYKYVDRAGRVFWSEPSSRGELSSHTVTNIAVDGSIEITVSTPNICAMPQGGFNFAGSISCQVYVATATEPDIYKYVDEFQVDQFHTGALPVLTVSAPASDTETRFLYTIGGELENVTAPPCLSIEMHRGRLWLAATDEPKVWFSKPSQPLRGPEFCLEFTFDLPSFATALVSNEDRIIIFTKKVIYFVEGDGPGSTGVPVTGFSKLAQLYVDEGCVEQNAAVRTPYGIIYRGRKGFMLLTRSLELKYIGESVEDSFEEYVDSVLAMVHDTRLGCCAITVVKDGEYRCFRFWYDSAQWSIDTLYNGELEIRDAVALKSDYYIALPSLGVWKSQDPVLGTIHADNGNYAQWVWETGWLRFSDLHSFKRIWRMYVTARSLDEDDPSTLQIDLYKDFESDPFQTETVSIVAGETTSFRVHLRKQKVKNFKVRLTKLQGVGSVEAWGCEVLGLGFEIALKKGGAKLGKAETR